MIFKGRTLKEATKNKHNVDHFLSLYFLRVYNIESRSAVKFNCNEKTWRKWVWIYVKAIQCVAFKIVSLIDNKCFKI